MGCGYTRGNRRCIGPTGSIDLTKMPVQRPDIPLLDWLGVRFLFSDDPARAALGVLLEFYETQKFHVIEHPRQYFGSRFARF